MEKLGKFKKSLENLGKKLLVVCDYSKFLTFFNFGHSFSFEKKDKCILVGIKLSK